MPQSEPPDTPQDQPRPDSHEGSPSPHAPEGEPVTGARDTGEGTRETPTTSAGPSGTKASLDTGEPPDVMPGGSGGGEGDAIPPGAGDFPPEPWGPRPGSHAPASLRHIDWRGAFPFVNLFRAFSVAIHPSKLLLGLAAILLLYVGGRVMDGVWPAFLAFPGEVAAFQGYLESAEEAPGRPAARLRDFREIRRQERSEARQLLERRARLVIERGEDRDLQPEDVGLRQIRREIVRERDRQLERVRERHDAAVEEVEGDERLSGAERAARLERLRQEQRRAVRGAYAEAAREWDLMTRVRGRGLFMEFYRYQAAQFDGLVRAVLEVNVSERDGVFSRLHRMFYVTPVWAFSQHPVYFTLLSLWGLVLLAVFGGAIARIAAVEVARGEKIALRSALRFSTGKFVSFLSAPLIPILMVVVLGLTVAVAGLIVGNIPIAGEIVIGLGLFLALLAGLAIALTVLGLAGGFSLMYPTIASEGSDSFDALSRSFSYLYTAPWRLAFYAVVSLIYGAIVYLFVRLFVWLVLITTHVALGLLIFRSAAGRPILEAIWPRPAGFHQLSYEVEFINLGVAESIAAALVAFWVYMFIALLPAFVFSLWVSLSTLAYFLLRRDVDATDLDEVYLDPHDEEYAGYSDTPDEPEVEPQSNQQPGTAP